MRQLTAQDDVQSLASLSRLRLGTTVAGCLGPAPPRTRPHHVINKVDHTTPRKVTRKASLCPDRADLGPFAPLVNGELDTRPGAVGGTLTHDQLCRTAVRSNPSGQLRVRLQRNECPLHWQPPWLADRDRYGRNIWIRNPNQILLLGLFIVNSNTLKVLGTTGHYFCNTSTGPNQWLGWTTARCPQ